MRLESYEKENNKVNLKKEKNNGNDSNLYNYWFCFSWIFSYCK